MVFIVTSDRLNKLWQADVKAVMNFRFYKISEYLLTTRWTVSFPLTAPIHAAVRQFSAALLINCYRANVEFKFNSASCYKNSQYFAQVEMLFWTDCVGFPQASLFNVLLLYFSWLQTDAIHKSYYNFVIQGFKTDALIGYVLSEAWQRNSNFKGLIIPRHRWEDNIKMDLLEIWCGSMDWIELAQDRDWWRAIETAVMYNRVP